MRRGRPYPRTARRPNFRPTSCWGQVCRSGLLEQPLDGWGPSVSEGVVLLAARGPHRFEADEERGLRPRIGRIARTRSLLRRLGGRAVRLSAVAWRRSHVGGAVLCGCCGAARPSVKSTTPTPGASLRVRLGRRGRGSCAPPRASERGHDRSATPAAAHHTLRRMPPHSRVVLAQYPAPAGLRSWDVPGPPRASDRSGGSFAPRARPSGPPAGGGRRQRFGCSRAPQARVHEATTALRIPDGCRGRFRVQRSARRCAPCLSRYPTGETFPSVLSELVPWVPVLARACRSDARGCPPALKRTRRLWAAAAAPSSGCSLGGLAWPRAALLASFLGEARLSRSGVHCRESGAGFRGVGRQRLSDNRRRGTG